MNGISHIFSHIISDLIAGLEKIAYQSKVSTRRGDDIIDHPRPKTEEASFLPQVGGVAGAPAGSLVHLQIAEAAPAISAVSTPIIPS